jgi:hypothetical protein
MEHISSWYVQMMLICWAKINMTKRSAEILLETGREVGLEVKTGKSKYMVMYCHHNARQRHNLTANKSFGER